MRLDFIPLDKLLVSKTNMRHGKRPPDVTDILPTIRRRGVVVPLIARSNCASDGYEIVAGARRLTAAGIVFAERRAEGDEGEPQDDMLPCAILDGGDDADAIELSLIENVARLDPDEVTQWATLTRLVREGRTPDDIAATFGRPDLAVQRILRRYAHMSVKHLQPYADQLTFAPKIRDDGATQKTAEADGAKSTTAPPQGRADFGGTGRCKMLR